MTSASNRVADVLLLNMVGVFVNVLLQGLEYDPQYWSTRLVFLLMMISSVVIFEMYAASYTAFLAVVKLAVPFDSLLTMYKNTDFKIGSSVGTAYKQFVIAVSRMTGAGCRSKE